MKIAWLVWEYDDDKYPIVVPDEMIHMYDHKKRTQIVYCEVAK